MSERERKKLRSPVYIIPWLLIFLSIFIIEKMENYLLKNSIFREKILLLCVKLLLTIKHRLGFRG